MSTSDIHEQLIASIVEDNADEVIRLLELGIDPNKRCDEGVSLLYGAILLGNPIVISGFWPRDAGSAPAEHDVYS